MSIKPQEVDMLVYPKMMYGWYLMPRIVSLRLVPSPDILTFISEYDFNNAYRRISHIVATVTQTVLCIAILER